jgi:glycosyltransferase involved in cell wall biosynthesis
MDQPLRIAVWHNLDSGGGKRALHDHVRGLVARGHHVEAWCPPTADLSYLPLGRYCTEHVIPCETRAPRTRGKLRRLTAHYWQALADLEAMEEHSRRCAEEICRKGFDVLFANSCIFLAAPMIGRYVKVPSLLYLQEPLRSLHEAQGHQDGNRLSWIGSPPGPLPRRPFPWKPLDRLLEFKWRSNLFVQEMAEVQSLRVRARAEVANARAFDVILCNSLFSRESLLRSYGLESRVCYLGIDCDAFQPSKEKRPYVVGLGAIIAPKRVDNAIRTLATIEPADRPSLLWVANWANPHYLAHVHSLADALGVRFEPRIMVSQEELAAILGGAAVMINAPRLEPFGYPPLEANACGTWVVTIAEAGMRESITDGENGDLLDPSDQDAVGRAILRYTEDLGLAREAGLRARRYVQEKWGLGPSIDRLEKQLLKVSGRSPSGVPTGLSASLVRRV